MRSVYLSLAVDSMAEAERIYSLLADGGQIFTPMQETFFASRFGMLRDKFGTSWMIAGARTQSVLLSVLQTCRQQNRDAGPLLARLLCSPQPRTLNIKQLHSR